MNLIVPSAIPSLTVGGVVFTDLQNLIVLVSFCNSTASHTSTPRKWNGSAGYQVTAGKTLKIRAMRMQIPVATAGVDAPHTLGYADNDVGLDGTTAHTNLVYIGGSSGISTGLYGISAVASFYESPIWLDVPATKYVAHLTNATHLERIMLFGYEV